MKCCVLFAQRDWTVLMVFCRLRCKKTFYSCFFDDSLPQQLHYYLMLLFEKYKYNFNLDCLISCVPRIWDFVIKVISSSNRDIQNTEFAVRCFCYLTELFFDKYLLDKLLEMEYVDRLSQIYDFCLSKSDPDQDISYFFF